MQINPNPQFISQNQQYNIFIPSQQQNPNTLQISQIQHSQSQHTNFNHLITQVTLLSPDFQYLNSNQITNNNIISLQSFSSNSPILTDSSQIQRNNFNIQTNFFDYSELRKRLFKRLKDRIIKNKNVIKPVKWNKMKRSNEEKSQKVCPICLQQFDTKRILGIIRCGHQFHKICIKEWFKQSHNCPLCRSFSLI